MTSRADLIKPSDFEIIDPDDGKIHKFVLSKFDAISGREIVMKYPMTAIPKVFGGDYAENEEIMVKLMGFVCADRGNDILIPLKTKDLIRNHVPDWEMCAKLEAAMMEKNCSFFRNGQSWCFFEKLTQIFLTKISETLTRLSVQSSPTEKPPSTN